MKNELITCSIGESPWHVRTSLGVTVKAFPYHDQPLISSEKFPLTINRVSYEATLEIRCHGGVRNAGLELQHPGKFCAYGVGTDKAREYARDLGDKIADCLLSQDGFAELMAERISEQVTRAAESRREAAIRKAEWDIKLLREKAAENTRFYLAIAGKQAA